MASGSQAIAREHRNYQDRSKKGSGNIERDPAIRTTGTVGPRGYAGRLIDLNTTLLVLPQQFEPVRDIDKQARRKKILQSREKTLLATQL